VLRMSMATVMGPTPPGTGVMAAALRLAAPKRTSPQTKSPLVLLVGLLPRLLLLPMMLSVLLSVLLPVSLLLLWLPR